MVDYVRPFPALAKLAPLISVTFSKPVTVHEIITDGNNPAAITKSLQKDYKAWVENIISNNLE